MRSVFNIFILVGLSWWMISGYSDASKAPVCHSVVGVAVESGEFGFTQHKNDSRCEGLLGMPKSGASLSVRSVNRGTLRYTFRDPESSEPEPVIVVQVPSIDVGDQQIELVSRRLTGDDPYYQMLTQVSPGESFSWSIGTVIEPKEIPAHQLGITARVIKESDIDFPVFLPIVVTSEQMDQETDPGPVVVRILTSVELNHIEVFEWCDGIEQVVSARPNAPRDNIIEFALTDPCPGPGKVVVDVESVANQSQEIRPLVFYTPR